MNTIFFLNFFNIYDITQCLQSASFRLTQFLFSRPAPTLFKVQMHFYSFCTSMGVSENEVCSVGLPPTKDFLLMYVLGASENGSRVRESVIKETLLTLC